MLTTFFRGKVAFALKATVLALVTALLLTLTQSAFAQKQYVISVFLAIAIFILNYTYFSKKRVPLKFFIPGVILLTAFVITPIIYTLVMSTYTYKTGNYISKEQATERIKTLAVEPDENGSAFDIVVGEFRGEPALLVSDINQNKYFISTVKDRILLDSSLIGIDEYGVANSAPRFYGVRLWRYFRK